jgi:hypothetical protein
MPVDTPRLDRQLAAPPPYARAGSLESSPRDWPCSLGQSAAEQRDEPDEPVATYSEAFSDAAKCLSREFARIIDTYRRTAWTHGQKLVELVTRAAGWTPKPDALPAVEALPNVEVVVRAVVPPRQTLRLRGRIRSVARGRQDSTLTDAEWASFSSEGGDE